MQYDLDLLDKDRSKILKVLLNQFVFYNGRVDVDLIQHYHNLNDHLLTYRSHLLERAKDQFNGLRRYHSAQTLHSCKCMYHSNGNDNPCDGGYDDIVTSHYDHNVTNPVNYQNASIEHEDIDNFNFEQNQQGVNSESSSKELNGDNVYYNPNHPKHSEYRENGTRRPKSSYGLRSDQVKLPSSDCKDSSEAKQKNRVRFPEQSNEDRAATKLKQSSSGGDLDAKAGGDREFTDSEKFRFDSGNNELDIDSGDISNSSEAEEEEQEQISVLEFDSKVRQNELRNLDNSNEEQQKDDDSDCEYPNDEEVEIIATDTTQPQEYSDKEIDEGSVEYGEDFEEDDPEDMTNSNDQHDTNQQLASKTCQQQAEEDEIGLDKDQENVNINNNFFKVIRYNTLKYSLTTVKVRFDGLKRGNIPRKSQQSDDIICNTEDHRKPSWLTGNTHTVKVNQQLAYGSHPIVLFTKYNVRHGEEIEFKVRQRLDTNETSLNGEVPKLNSFVSQHVPNWFSSGKKNQFIGQFVGYDPWPILELLSDGKKTHQGIQRPPRLIKQSITKRLNKQNFSLNLFVDDMIDYRLSACCPFRHEIGQKLGQFTLIGVFGGKPCSRCQRYNKKIQT